MAGDHSSSQKQQQIQGRHQKGGFLPEKTRACPVIRPVGIPTPLLHPSFRGGNHTLEKTRIRPEIFPVYRVGRQKREVSVSHQPQGISAPSSAARKGISGHYRVGQLNHNFSFHRGVKGGHPLTFLPTNPVQGVVMDGAPGSTTVGIMEGDGTPAACSNHQEGKGGTPTQDTGGKILLNGWPPP